MCRFREIDLAHRKEQLRDLAKGTRPATQVGRPDNRVGEGEAMWNQVYNPLGSAALSTVAAAIPVVTLLVLIASGKVKAHIAAIIAVILTNLIAIFIFT